MSWSETSQKGKIPESLDKKNGDIKWNFTKFLIDREGNIQKRFEPTEDMEVVKAEVEKPL